MEIFINSFLIILLILCLIRVILVNKKLKKIEFYNEQQKKEVKDLYKENEMLIESVENAKKEYNKLSIELKNKGEELFEIKTLNKKRLKTVFNRLIDDNMKWILDQLTSENYTTAKEKLKEIIFFCDKCESPVNEDKIKKLEMELENKHEKVMRDSFEKYEQLKINELIKQEAQLHKECKETIKHLENQQIAIENNLNAIIKKTANKQNEETLKLQQLLKDVREKIKNANSVLQKAKAGHVYILSNTGSFGNDIYKIGMTRHLSLDDKVRELSGDSVPFSYDTHMIISCNDAPALVRNLHKHFNKKRINKVNFRKDFFKVNIQEIAEAVKKYHGVIEYQTDTETSEYQQSINISDEDFNLLTEKNEKLESEYQEKGAIDKTVELNSIEVEVGQNQNGEDVIPCPECGKSILVSEFQDTNKYLCPNCNAELQAL